MCIQADTFLARTSGFGPLRTAAYSNLICGLVTDGVWAKLDALYILATLDTGNAVLNLVSTNYTLTANGAPAFAADGGYTGVASSTTVYLDTGFNPATAAGLFTLNSAHLSGWTNTNNQTSNEMMGAYDGSNLADITFQVGGLGERLNNASANTVANANNIGHLVAARTGATTDNIYVNGTGIAPDTTPSVALPNSNIFILNVSSSGSAVNGSAAQIAAASIGSGLTGGDATNFYNQLNTYMALLPFGPDPSGGGGTTTYHWNLGVNV